MGAGPKTWANCFTLPEDEGMMSLLCRQDPFGQNFDCRKALMHIVNLLVKYMSSQNTCVALTFGKEIHV